MCIYINIIHVYNALCTSIRFYTSHTFLDQKQVTSTMGAVASGLKTAVGWAGHAVTSVVHEGEKAEHAIVHVGKEGLEDTVHLVEKVPGVGLVAHKIVNGVVDVGDAAQKILPIASTIASAVAPEFAGTIQTISGDVQKATNLAKMAQGVMKGASEISSDDVDQVGHKLVHEFVKKHGELPTHMSATFIGHDSDGNPKTVLHTYNELDQGKLLSGMAEKTHHGRAAKHMRGH